MKAPDPYTLNSFWMVETAEKLKNPLISDGYRKRLETIYHEAWKLETKTDVGHHYRNDRK